MKLTAIDLFSGVGGTSLGLRRAGFRIAAAVELNRLAVESYQLNFEGVKVWDSDIRKVAARDVMKEAGIEPGELALLAACPPCQGFSTIRTLNGSRKIEDGRNGLMREVTRFVRVLQPMTVLAENVPGLAHSAVFHRFLEDLRRMRYQLRHETVDVSQFGVPQRRRRLLIVASRLGDPPRAKRSGKRNTVRDALRGLPTAGTSGDALHEAPEKRTQRIAKLIQMIPLDGGSRTDLGAEYQLVCHTNTDGFKDIYGRMAWDKVAPTITGGCVNPSKGRFLHPEEHRAITLREAAVLQSFPADYQMSLRKGRYAVAEMIGNALPPEFVRRHALALKHHIDGHAAVALASTGSAA